MVHTKNTILCIDTDTYLKYTSPISTKIVRVRSIFDSSNYLNWMSSYRSIEIYENLVRNFLLESKSIV